MMDILREEFNSVIFGGAIFVVAMMVDRELKTTAARNKKFMDQINDYKKQDNSKIFKQLSNPQANPTKKPIVIQRVIRQTNPDTQQIQQIHIQELPVPNPNKKPIIIQRVMAQTTPDTLQINIRELPLHCTKNDIYNHISGGSFKFSYLSRQVIAQLNNTKILSSILSQKEQNVQIFGKMEPIVKKATYFLKNCQYLSMIGVLSYDFGDRKFRVEAVVMGTSIEEIYNYFQGKYILATIPRIFTIIMMGVSLYLLKNPIIKLAKYLTSKLPWFHKKTSPEQQAQHFLQKLKNKTDIKTSPKNVYECVSCRRNITNIIYSCGHLCSCEECYLRWKAENDGDVRCPVCGKGSKDQLKIFFT